jgi:hypothetical protein
LKSVIVLGVLTYAVCVALVSAHVALRSKSLRPYKRWQGILMVIGAPLVVTAVVLVMFGYVFCVAFFWLVLPRVAYAIGWLHESLLHEGESSKPAV